MAASTKKFITTPLGTVQPYAYIQRPDTEYNDRGEYRIKLAIPSDKAQKLIDQITAAHEANVESLKNGRFKGKRLKEGDMPFYEEDGEVIFTFKMYGSFKDKESGEMKGLTLRVYDAAGKRIFDVPNISGGSVGKVEFSMFPYPPSGAVGASVKLQLSKFQLKTLVEYKAGGNDTFGEDDDDMAGGYVAPTKPKDEFPSDDEDEQREDQSQEDDIPEDEDF